jgi:hypothetical protein
MAREMKLEKKLADRQIKPYIVLVKIPRVDGRIRGGTKKIFSGNAPVFCPFGV